VYYLKELRENNSLLIMKVGISINGLVLIKLASSFPILGNCLEVSGSTPTVPQTRVLAQQQTWRGKPFGSVTF